MTDQEYYNLAKYYIKNTIISSKINNAVKSRVIKFRFRNSGIYYE